MILILGVACSKNTNPETVKESKSAKTKQVNGKQADVVNQNRINPKGVFSVSRDGNVATINILADFSSNKNILIKRNATGFHKDMALVADLDSGAHRFEDTLPNAGAFYYWLRVEERSGAHKNYGPVRVGPDADNKGIYSSAGEQNEGEQYHWQAGRSYTTANITWDFPVTSYSKIAIKRNTSAKMLKRKEVYATLEPTGNFVDTLPDPEADYWYWIEATLENGKMITQGPIKAEFPMN